MNKNWSSPDSLRIQLQKRWDRGLYLKGFLNQRYASPSEQPHSHQVPEFPENSIHETPNEILPISIPIKGPSPTELTQNFPEVRIWIQQWQETENDLALDLQWKEMNNRVHGRNPIPFRLDFSQWEDLAKFCNRINQFVLFQLVATRILSEFPDLLIWFLRKPMEIFPWLPVNHQMVLNNSEYLDTDSIQRFLEKLFLIIRWILENPDSGLYLRQVSVRGIDTKFIEKHQSILGQWLEILKSNPQSDTSVKSPETFIHRFGFKNKPHLIRFRILDPSYSIGGFFDLSVPLIDLAKQKPRGIQRVIITENDINGLTLPQLSGSMVLFGQGYSVTTLARIPWLYDLDLVYWGDVDTHGFCILNEFRSIFPSVQSICMDYQTLIHHREHWGTEPSPRKTQLLHLNREEQEVYQALMTNLLTPQLRLEQEFITYQWVLDRLKEIV